MSKKGKTILISSICIVLVAIIAVSAVFIVKGINKKEEAAPEAVITNFTTAFNKDDLDGMMNCFEPSVQKTYGQIKSVSQYIGIDLETLSSKIGFVNDLISDYADIDNLDPKLSTDVTDVKISDDKATVYFDITLLNGSNSVVTKSTSVEMVKIDEQWYIASDALTQGLLD